LTYEYAGGYVRAILDFDQAVKLTPDDPDAVYGRGRAYGQNSEYLRAMADRAHYM
jgi:regulator of sirC expression with transglutaminase-like and TPR domain